MSAPPEPRIEVRGLSRWHGEVLALSEVSFTLGPGVHGLLGPNGAGKSTLVGALAGVVRPSRGEVRVLGGDPARDPRVRARLGYASHGEAGYDELPAAALVTWLLRLDGFSAAEARDRARAALMRVGLERFADRPHAALSRGMKQRVKVAQAIAHDPQVVLLDEPFVGCDPVARDGLRRLIADFGAGGRTVLVSSHVLGELEPLVESVVILSGGRVVTAGDLDALAAQATAPRTVRVRVDRPRDLGARLLVEELVAGAAVLDDGTLELTTRESRALVARLAGLVLAGDLRLERLEAPEDRLEARYREAVNQAGGRA